MDQIKQMNTIPETELSVKNNNPKVSVLTPLYNTKEQYLRECIESILNQTYKNYEFILLNDSPDNKDLARIVKEYDDPRIVYLENEANLGISASRNKLIKLAKGEYLAIFDHDDISLPNRLALEVEYLDNNPNIGVVSGNIIFFPEPRSEKQPSDNIEIKAKLMHEMVVPHTAIMLRKEILEKNNIYYEEFYSPAEDYRLVLRLIGCTMFHNLDEFIVKYRRENSNTSYFQSKKMEDRGALCRNYAAQTYPFFFALDANTHLYQNKKNNWIYLFNFLPLIKIRRSNYHKYYYLFGIIPLFKI